MYGTHMRLLCHFCCRQSHSSGLACLNNYFLIVKAGAFNKEKALLVGACLIISKFHEGPWTALVSLYQAYKY